MARSVISSAITAAMAPNWMAVSAIRQPLPEHAEGPSTILLRGQRTIGTQYITAISDMEDMSRCPPAVRPRAFYGGVIPERYWGKP